MTLLSHLGPVLRPALIVILSAGSLAVSAAVAKADGGDGPRGETAKNAPQDAEVTRGPGDVDTKNDVITDDRARKTPGDAGADSPTTAASVPQASTAVPATPVPQPSTAVPAAPQASTAVPAAPVGQPRAPVLSTGSAAKVVSDLIAPPARPRSAPAPVRRPAAPSGDVAPASAPAAAAAGVTAGVTTGGAAGSTSAAQLPTSGAQRRPTARPPATGKASAVARPPAAAGVRLDAARSTTAVLAASTEQTGRAVAPLLAGLSGALLLVLGLYATALRARRWLYDAP